MKSSRPTAVPKHMQTTYDAVVALTDAFCRDHLTGEYRDLAQAMTASLSRKRPSPLASGQPRTWACGIIHVLGQLNFLSDKTSQPHMTMAEVCTAFGVGQSSTSAKARVISGALHTASQHECPDLPQREQLDALAGSIPDAIRRPSTVLPDPSSSRWSPS